MQTLSEAEVRQRISERLDTSEFAGKRVLLIVPDATRTARLPLLFAAVRPHRYRRRDVDALLHRLAVRDHLCRGARRRQTGPRAALHVS